MARLNSLMARSMPLCDKQFGTAIWLGISGPFLFSRLVITLMAVCVVVIVTCIWLGKGIDE